MTNQSLFSAPNEEYPKHIERCQEKFNIVFPVFKQSVKRIFCLDDEEIAKDYMFQMITFHDLGKLTKKWQDNLSKNRKLPSHSTFGAAYLYKKLGEENNLLKDLKYAVVFAILIHHTDKGLRGDNTERPDVQAINDGVVALNGIIEWHENTKNLPKDLFPENARNLNVLDLKQMARSLRIWSLGTELLGQHQRRMKTSLAHHILKLCDVSASNERKDYQKDSEDDYFGGWLMAKQIAKYVESIKRRMQI